MKKVKATALKIVGTILAACGITTTFTACYGMPINYDNYPEMFKEKVTVRADLNDDGEVTEDEDITSQVKMGRVQSTSSEPDFQLVEVDFWYEPDDEGNLYIYQEGDYIFKDLDPEDGTVFKTKIQNLEYKPDQVVILEKKKD